MSEHKGKTNKINEIKLESGIDRVVWSEGAISAGGKAGLQVDTHFVGNGSEIKVEIKDAKGKNLGNFTKKITGNKFWTEIEIPEKAEGSVTATVKLPKHNAEMKSNEMTVFPPIKITNLKWDKNEAKRGDILKLTADVKGMYDGAEAKIEIYEHDDDGAHDPVVSFPVSVKNQKIETQWEFQYVDDTDDIPTHEEAENGYNNPEYFFRVNIGGVSKDSGLLRFKDWIEIEWTYGGGYPASNKNFKLVSADGNETNGTFDELGKFRIENVSPGPFNIVLEEESDDNSGSTEDTPAEKTIKIVLKDPQDNKYSNKKYEIRFGQKIISGNTDREGMIQQQIPANILQARLFVWLKDDEEKASFSTIILFQDFESEDSIAGIQSRLQNLGYYAGKVDGVMGNMTKEAIKIFQSKNNLTVTGEIDSELSQKVLSKYDNG